MSASSISQHFIINNLYPENYPNADILLSLNEDFKEPYQKTAVFFQDIKNLDLSTNKINITAHYIFISNANITAKDITLNAERVFLLRGNISATNDLTISSKQKSYFNRTKGKIEAINKLSLPPEDKQIWFNEKTSNQPNITDEQGNILDFQQIIEDCDSGFNRIPWFLKPTPPKPQFEKTEEECMQTSPFFNKGLVENSFS